MVSGLQLVDLDDLQLAEWTDEAVATAQSEGEALQINSVRASAARRLGLTQSSRAMQRQREPRFEATLDVVEAAIQHWAKPLSAERLFGWHAALFPNGRSGITRIVVGGWRNQPEPMQIVTPRLGRPDVVHYQAPRLGRRAHPHGAADQLVQQPHRSQPSGRVGACGHCTPVAGSHSPL